MDTKNLTGIIFAAMNAAAMLAQAQAQARQETLANRILRMSAADQIAYIQSELDEGMPADRSPPLGMLVLNRSSLVLPMIERKIEEVLKAASPEECFSDKSVKPQAFVDLAAWTIPSAGDVVALREIGKLLAIDERRFDTLVGNTMATAQNRRNPFAVAYQGFEIGDPAIDKRIMEWIEAQFDNKTAFRQGQLKHWWAEAMAERYSIAPGEVQWVNDPIATRLKPSLARALHDEILRLAAEATSKRPKN